MNYEAVSDFAATWGILYFVLMFAGVLVYALNPKSKNKFDHAAQIPLQEDNSNE